LKVYLITQSETKSSNLLSRC